MNKNLIIQFSLALVFIFTLMSKTVAQSNDTITIGAQDFEYMTIISRQYDSKTSKIYVSTSGGDYQEIKLDISKVKNRFDYKPVLKIIEKYNKQGWKILSSNIAHIGESSDEFFYTYYFLKRLKLN